jgi:probable addiction module antidote protein
MTRCGRLSLVWKRRCRIRRAKRILETIEEAISQLAKDTGLNRESLYMALTPGAKPGYDTILRVLSALKIRLVATH